MKTGSFLHALLHFIFPSRCLACDTPLLRTPTVCPDCMENFQPIRQKVCKTCSMPLDEKDPSIYCHDCLTHPQPFSELRALSFYKGTIVELVHSLKFRKRWSAANTIADLIVTHIDKDFFDVVLLIPVPLHPKRQKKRGYNQSALVLNRISFRHGIPVIENILKRKKNTEAQSLLSRTGRAENIKDAFLLTGKADKLKDKHVLLFDDVTTTGATISEICSLLQTAEPASLRVLTAAKAL